MTFNLHLKQDRRDLDLIPPAASLVEDLDLYEPNSEGGSHFTLEAWCEAVRIPYFILRQRYLPDQTSGFLPSYLFVPETNTVFIGAGSRTCCYDLSEPAQKWTEYPIYGGFRAWNRHEDLIVLYADQEIGGYDLSGRNLWGACVTPGWSYMVDGEQILLDEPIGPISLDQKYKQAIFEITKGPLG